MSTPPSPAWGPHGVRTGTLRTRHRTRRSWRRHCCAPTIRPRRPLTSSSRSARCRPSSAIRTSTVRLRSSPRAAAVLSPRYSGPTPTRPRGSPSGSPVPRPGPHHRRNIRRCVDRHGSPLPQLVHGGPGRAGGGEELGGVRSVLHHMQRTAVQGSPDLVTAVTGEWVDGAARRHNGHRSRCSSTNSRSATVSTRNPG